MYRIVLAASALIMPGNAQAMTVLDFRIASVAPRHDATPASVLAAVHVDRPSAAAPMNHVAGIAGAMTPVAATTGSPHRSANATSGGSQIPDAVTWGLLILGFGYIGLAASRRRPAVAA